MIEEWTQIPKYENYQISTFGRIIRITGVKVKAVKPFFKQGYVYVGLCKNGIQTHFRVHRLVADAFIPNPLNLPVVNHKDENKTNNRVDNLEWCDSSYNANYGNRNRKISEKNSIPVVALDKVSRAEVKYFTSMTEAKLTIPKADITHISECCKGLRKTAGGYKWRFA